MKVFQIQALENRVDLHACLTAVHIGEDHNTMSSQMYLILFNSHGNNPCICICTLRINMYAQLQLPVFEEAALSVAAIFAFRSADERIVAGIFVWAARD